LVGDGRNRDPGSRKVNSLVIAELSAVYDSGDDLRPTCADYLKLDFTIAQKDAAAGRDFLREQWVVGRKPLGVAFDRFRGNSKFIAFFELSPIPPELAGPDFRTR